MTQFTLGEATARALGRVRAATTRGQADRRIDGRVLRGSMEAGTFEEGFFTAPAAGDCDRMLRAARAALDAGRRLRRAERAGERSLSARERACAAISAGTVRVYEELCALARLNRGRVYPSYDRLADVTALGRATVARALRALEAAGFLVRQRRFRRVDGCGAGPRYAQTSNAYRPVMPLRLLGLLPRWLRPAPVPVDALQHATAHAAEQAAMRATLSCRELGDLAAEGALGRALARLGAALDQALSPRESHPGPQSLPKLFHPAQSRNRTGTERP